MDDRKVVLLTGAAGGIGKATAFAFARQNYRIALADVDAAGLHLLAADLSAAYGTDCLIAPGDLADLAYTESLVGRTLEKWDRLDVLVNNAAWRTIETMRTMTVDTWEQTLRVCLTAPAFLAKWAAREMEKRNSPGVVVNVSSVMAERAGGTSPAYIAAKGALESLTRELAVTFGRSGIRVVGLSPGSVDTAMSADYEDGQGTNISHRMVDEVNALTPLGRPGRPEEIAEAIYWLSTEAASFITGTTLLADGGLKHNFSSYPIKKQQFPDEY